MRNPKLLAVLATLVSMACLLPPSSAQLVVTEVMYNPRIDNVWEWIEVRNTGSSAVDLANYIAKQLGDVDQASPRITIDPTYAQNTVIGPGQVAVIYDANYGSVSSPLADPQNFVDANFRAAWGLDETVPLIGANAWPALSNTPGSVGQSIGFWPSAEAWRMDQTPVEDEPGVFTNRTTSFNNAALGIDFSDSSFPDDDNKSSITWTGTGSNSDGDNWVLSSVGDMSGAKASIEVKVDGIVNNTDDLGNPGIAPPGVQSTPGLQFTEIMYDPASTPDNDWEWVEVYNGTANDIDLAGWVLDDKNSSKHSAANILTGIVPAGGTAILYDSNQPDFAAAWGETLNLIAVNGWTTLMALDSAGDQIALWASYSSYENAEDWKFHQNADVVQNFLEDDDFPALSDGSSIRLLDLSLDPTDPESWVNSSETDGVSFHANGVTGDGGGMVTLHQGGDVGSPGTFIVQGETLPGDFNEDGKVDGLDFLEWQRGNSPDPLSLDDLATWQGNYGMPASASLGAVPEPGTIVLLAAITPWLLLRSRRS